MNTRKTLFLALVLGVAVLYLTKVALPGREEQALGQRALSKLQSGEIAAIDLARRPQGGDIERCSVVHNGANSAIQDSDAASKWSLQGVRGAVLDTAVLAELIRTVKELPLEGPLSERDLHGDLAVYGLDKPALTLVVRTRGEKASEESVELAFGKKNEYLSKRYVKVSGRSGVFLVPEPLFTALDKGQSDLRSKTPVQFNVSDVREVVLTSAEGRIKVSQPAVGEWKILEPRELAASKVAVESLLNSLRSVTVGNFVDGGESQLDKYGFKTPRAEIQLQMREGLAPNQLSFSLARAAATQGAASEFYLKASGVDSLYQLSSDPSSYLIKRVNDLRDRDIISLTSSSIESVVSAGVGVTPTKIESVGLLWTVNGKDSDPVFIEQYLKDLAGLKADDFPENVPAGVFESPFLELTVVTKGADKKSFTLTIGKEFTPAVGEGAKEGTKEPLRYVRTSRSDNVYAIRDLEAKRLVPHEEALVAKATPGADGVK
jgi:hypothetical protein